MYSKIVLLLVSLINAEVAITVISFLSHLSKLSALKNQMSLFTIVITSNQAGVFVIRRSFIGGDTRRINTSN